MSVTGVPESIDLLLKIKAIVKDDSAKLADSDYESAIADALNRYSRHRPDTKAVDITGNGTHGYDLPSGWIEGFSAIKSIEYPIDDVPATLLDQDEFEIYQAPTKKQIRLLNDSPAATDSFRAIYTILRTTLTILTSDVDAFCSFAAAISLETLANAFAQTSDSTIAADSVNYRTKSYEFAQRAKRLMQMYKEHMGIKEDDTTPAASAVVDLDMKYPGGGERLTHPRWTRKRR